MGRDEGKSAWVVKSSSDEKPWGSETQWRSPNSVSVKTLTLRKGNRNSFKYSKIKDELLICATGKIKAYFANQDLLDDVGDLLCEVLEPGMALAVQSGCPYRLEAIEDSTVLEVATKNLTSHDAVRLHDDYGRQTEKVSSYMQEVIKKWFQT